MKAWRVYEAGKIQLDELKSQPVGENCVKLKMSLSALSITDRKAYEGESSNANFPLIIGRQGVGMVTETGENVTSLVRGDRVALDPYACCRGCAPCKNGKTNDCEKMLTYGVDEDGFLRDFATVPYHNAYKLPDRVRDEDAVFLEHIAMAINALNKLGLEKGEHIVIVGANVIGIILAQVAIYYQAVPIIVDTRQDRLDIAEELGVYYTINAVDADVLKKVFSLTGGRMAEAVAHMASSSMPANRSFDLVSKNGRAAIIGWSGVGSEVNVPLKKVLDRQLTVYAVNNGSKSMPSAINMLANKTVNVEPMISKIASFNEVDKVLEELKESPDKYIKVLIKT